MSQEEGATDDHHQTSDPGQPFQIVTSWIISHEDAIFATNKLFLVTIVAVFAFSITNVSSLPSHNWWSITVMYNSITLRFAFPTSLRHFHEEAVGISLHAFGVPDLRSLPMMAIPDLQTHMPAATALDLALPELHAANHIGFRLESETNPGSVCPAAIFAARAPRRFQISVEREVLQSFVFQVLRRGNDGAVMKLARSTIFFREECNLEHSPRARQIIGIHYSPHRRHCRWIRKSFSAAACVNLQLSKIAFQTNLIHILGPIIVFFTFEPIDC
mmetsp:Transcript_99694/g.183179  ORF Transcript_99694/g.183179 Transcript_99694/m.183179 type:complete len:273 (+) Transcript_99694:778-1596(+)